MTFIVEGKFKQLYRLYVSLVSKELSKSVSFEV
jgi:hypothetical protein